MKRALLIAGGTVGGLGAVLSITPPQLSSQGMTGLGIGSVTSSAGIAAKSTTSQSPTAIVPQAATPASSVTSATKKRTIKATQTKVASHKVAPTPSTRQTKTIAPTPTQTKTIAPTPRQTKTVAPTPRQTKTVAPTPRQTKTVAPTPTKTVAPPPASKGASGTFTGSSVFVDYGTVQVQITVVNGKITDAQAIQAPSGRSGQFSQRALPILRQETLVAQSSQIQGVSGASYTSYGWYTSLVAALAKAGM